MSPAGQADAGLIAASVLALAAAFAFLAMPNERIVSATGQGDHQSAGGLLLDRDAGMERGRDDRAMAAGGGALAVGQRETGGQFFQ